MFWTSCLQSHAPDRYLLAVDIRGTLQTCRADFSFLAILLGESAIYLRIGCEVPTFEER